MKHRIIYVGLGVDDTHYHGGALARPQATYAGLEPLPIPGDCTLCRQAWMTDHYGGAAVHHTTPFEATQYK